MQRLSLCDLAVAQVRVSFFICYLGFSDCFSGKADTRNSVGSRSVQLAADYVKNVMASAFRWSNDLGFSGK